MASLALAILIFLSFDAHAVLMSESTVDQVAANIPAEARVGVFIGSFDPLHVSHEKLIETVLENNLVDFLIVGANDNMTHKPLASSWESRNSFLQAVYSKHPKVLIADDPNFGFPITGNTVNKVRESLKQTKVYTIIGNDIATMPHLYEDVPKMTFENGGQIDTWLVNVSRPELNKSAQVPSQIADIPVVTFNAGSGHSSSFVRKSTELLSDPALINPKVLQQAKKFDLYSLNSISCKKIL